MDPDFDTLPLEQQQAVVAACERFETALHSGRPDRAEDHLAGAPAEVPRGTLLRELLVTEIEHRQRAAPGYDGADLFDRLPADGAVVRQAIALTARPATPPLTHADGRPAVVGDYRLLAELGRGRFGVVFRAAHLLTDREAAVKIPHPATVPDPTARGQFLHEARAAARLDHPHVVPLRQVGEEGAACYLAYEYVPGPSLAAWLRARRGGPGLSGRQAAGLMVPVAEAVAHAHACGILHLDLKPENILLGDARDGPVPRVTDFGLARMTDEPSALSADGVLAGTPAYMAPEQAAGRLETDARTDVYALGAILYELLAGRPPVPEPIWHRAMVEVARGFPVRPRAIRPDVPPVLEAVCLKCLEKDPTRRYPSADALAADLRAVREGGRPAVPPLGWVGAVRWSAHRHPARAVGVTGVVTVGLVALAFLAWHVVTLRAANRDLTAAVTARDEANAALRRRAYADGILRAQVLADRHDRPGLRRALDALRPGPGEADPRGFEWFHLDRLADPTPHVELARDRGPVYAVAWSPDGTTVAAGGADRVLRLLDPKTAAVTARFPHPAEIGQVVFAPDGSRVATAADDGVVRVFSPADGSSVELTGHKGKVAGVAFAPDGRRVVTGGADRTVRVWALAAAAGRVFARTGSPVRAVAWSPDGTTVAAGQESDAGVTANLWEAETGRAEAGLVGHLGPVVSVGFPAAPGHLVTASRDGTLRVWGRGPNATGVRWGQSAAYGPLHERLNDAALSRDGTAAVVCRDGGVELWRLDEPAHAAAVARPVWLSGDVGRVWSAAFAPDGTAVVTGDATGAVRVWDISGPPPGRRTLSLPHPVGRLAFDPAGGRAAAYGSGPVSVVGLADGRYRIFPSPNQPDQAVRAAGFAGGRLVGWTSTGAAVGWGDGPPVSVGGGLAVPVTHRQAAAAPDGRSVFVAAPNEVRRVRADGTSVPVARGGSACVHLDAGGGRVAVAGFDGVVRVWAEAGGSVAELGCGDGRPQAVAVSADGRRVAAGCGGAVLVWDLGRPAEPLRLSGHRGSVTALGFSPDGRRLATGGSDATVRVWDADDGRELLALADHAYAVHAVGFDPTGRCLVSVAATGLPDGGSTLVIRDGGSE